MMKRLLSLAMLVGLLGVSQASVPAAAVQAPSLHARARSVPYELLASDAKPSTGRAAQRPLTVLMRSGYWFVFPRGCDGLRERRDVVIHFHGAHVTTVPRFMASGLDAVLIIINKGIGSGAYSDALALRSNVDELLERIEKAMADQCDLANAEISRLALSSWSAGYGGVEQFLRWRPERVDAVLLADGLHVGFTDRGSRTVDTARLEVFTRFARRAARSEKLMAITHSGIAPMEYAGAAETALALSEAIHAPTWPVASGNHGMWQLTAARRGQFYVEGYAGNDKAAHSHHLYSIGQTSFARLREYWEREDVRQRQ
ncbi:MAG: hypothetical protein JW940_26000 [Polyangiaceae bacterium]|nr:hypothetical protein [Polyangiaceae bacterium]